MTRKDDGLLNLFSTLTGTTGGFAPRDQRRGAVIRPIIVLLSAAYVLAVAGCHSNDAAPSATGQSGTGSGAGPQKPTAEQDAAKQREEQKGEAVHAASQAATGAVPTGQ